MSRTLRPEWADPVHALWRRTASDSRSIAFTELSAPRRSYRVSWTPDAIHVEATDASSACAAIHRFLRECGVWVTWDSALPVQVPPSRPLAPTGRVDGEAEFDQLYDLNFCTFSYTTPFWTWADWEREIDWMALHGVTMPLALVGHEAVLERVYSAHGMSTAEILDFLGDPVYLPFVFMGCVDSLGDPMTEDELTARLELGRRILTRERELGMTPVLPAFTGHVPKRLAPGEVHQRRWQGVETYALEAASPLVAVLAADIARAQAELLGTDHRYACDPFIETIPDGVDVRELAGALFSGMRAADPSAVWVLQTWPFSYQSEYWTSGRVVEFLDAFPTDGLELLDLYAEADPQWSRFDGFGGRPWLWCGLLDFGGRTDLVADLRAVTAGVRDARAAQHPPLGLGLSMEAIHVTPVFFEMICEARWSLPDDLDNWLGEFAAGRYSTTSPRAARAWRLLGSTVLDARAADIFPEKFISTVVLKPSYGLLEDPEAVLDGIRRSRSYDARALADAWRELAALAEEEPGLVEGPLGVDLIAVGQAVLVRLVDHHLATVVTAALSGEPTSGPLAEALDCLTGLDELASARPGSRLSTWEVAAGGRSEQARRLLTTWADEATPNLGDYAARLWSGLLSGYYRERWRLWGEHLADAVNPGTRSAASQALAGELDALTADVIGNGVAERPPADLLETTRTLIGRWSEPFARLGSPLPTTERTERP